MPERMSPTLRVGMIHGAYAAAYGAEYPIPPGAMYRRGWALAFRAARGLPPIERKHYEAGRCWCRARHASEQPAPRKARDATKPAPHETAADTRPAPPTALERARRAAQR